ncbi:hypothetical protein MMC21_005968 [Puttea exsequens]|nr:hypothetical protein [Puttea exsequens]
MFGPLLSLLLLACAAECRRLDHYRDPNEDIFHAKLSKRTVPGRYTPHPGPLEWFGMGDSYTAAPGAGDAYDEYPDPFDCYSSRGSYVPQLGFDFSFDEGSKFQFIACTGDTTWEVLRTQIDLISTELVADFIVMTLGGNDIGFGRIIKDCHVRPAGPFSEDCDQVIEISMDLIRGQELQDNMFEVYDGIFGKMPAGYHDQLIRIGHSAFFNDDDDSTWCNNQTFAIIPG